MDPGVRSHGMKADPPGSLWSKYECFLMSGWWDILRSSCLHVKLWSNSTNGKEVRTNKQTNERTNEHTKEHINGWTDKRKDENYISLGINAGGINCPPVSHLLQAQQAPALPYAKIVGHPGTGSYPAQNLPPSCTAYKLQMGSTFMVQFGTDITLHAIGTLLFSLWSGDFRFNVPLTTRSWRRELSLKSHPKDLRSARSNQRAQD